jgi:GT2 family glycosyltransferase
VKLPVDAVVVAYNSADHLRGCVESLVAIPGVRAIVVDNASPADDLATVADLPVTTITARRNGGFAAGCNLGWPQGDSPYVLFLNPDATIDATALARLVEALDREPRRAIAAPRIVDDTGALQHSLRRFPRLRTTYAQAFYLHRLAPRAQWTDEIIRAPETYAESGAQEWVSGACMLVRRDVLEELGGWDSGFFLYCEDIDLCRRVQDLGRQVWYEATATVGHVGGGSASRASTLPLLAASRVRYAFVHRSRPAALLECLGIGVEAATRLLTLREGIAGLGGHARAARLALRGALTGPRAAVQR